LHQQTEFLPEGLETPPQGLPVDLIGLEIIPDHKKPFGNFNGLGSYRSAPASSINQLLEVTPQVAPAYLAEPLSPGQVCTPAVRREDAPQGTTQESKKALRAPIYVSGK
jgi:hypothetical protein